MPWDWFIIDLSYVLVLIGGAMIFRTRRTSIGSWVAFGMLATFIGTILLWETWNAQMLFATASASSDAITQLKSAC